MYIFITHKKEFLNPQAEYEITEIFDGQNLTEYLNVVQNSKYYDNKSVEYKIFVISKTIINIKEFEEVEKVLYEKFLSSIEEKPIKCQIIPLEKEYEYKLSFTLEYGCPLYVKNTEKLLLDIKNIPNKCFFSDDCKTEILKENNLKKHLDYDIWFCDCEKYIVLHEKYKGDYENMKDIFGVKKTDLYIHEILSLFNYKKYEKHGDNYDFYYNNKLFDYKWIKTSERRILKNNFPLCDLYFNFQNEENIEEFKSDFIELYKNYLENNNYNPKHKREIKFIKKNLNGTQLCVIFPVSSYKMYKEIINFIDNPNSEMTNSEMKKSFNIKIAINDGVVIKQKDNIYVELMDGRIIFLKSYENDNMKKLQERWNKGEFLSEWAKNYYNITNKISNVPLVNY